MTQLANANAKVVAERLRTWNDKAVAEMIEYRGETTIVVPKRAVARSRAISAKSPRTAISTY